MQLKRTTGLSHPCRGYTLVETLLAIGVTSVVFAALLAGFTSGFKFVQNNRENARATQILTEKMEMIRLYNWEQINNTTYLPASFTNYFNPANTNDAGFKYLGTVTVTTPSATGEKYLDHMRQVTVQIKWRSGGIEHNRNLTTFVSEYGLQKYIY